MVYNRKLKFVTEFRIVKGCVLRTVHACLSHGINIS